MNRFPRPPSHRPLGQLLHHRRPVQSGAQHGTFRTSLQPGGEDLLIVGTIPLKQYIPTLVPSSESSDDNLVMPSLFREIQLQRRREDNKELSHPFALYSLTF